MILRMKTHKNLLMRMASSRCRAAIASLIVMIVGVIAPAPLAHAATIVVDSTVDNAIAGDGVCSLREAVNNANANTDTTGADCTPGSGADVIRLPAGAYILGTGREDANASGDLDILGSGGDLTIVGDGPDVTTISGPGYVVFVDRIFDIDPTNGANIAVTIRDLTIEEGHSGQGGGQSITVMTRYF